MAAGKAVLDTTADNRSQIRTIRNPTRDLMLDPIFIIDSISLLNSTASQRPSKNLRGAL